VYVAKQQVNVTKQDSLRQIQQLSSVLCLNRPAKVEKNNDPVAGVVGKNE
jgi:hypothetical protein